MKQKYEGKDLQSLLDLGREQGYLTFDQVNDFLPLDVSSPTDLRSALEGFQDMDIKVLADVPTDGTEGELEAEVKEGPDETAELAPAADSISESSDPVRLYLREIGIGGSGAPLLPCHTTGHAGPHPAVRKVEVNRQVAVLQVGRSSGW